MGYVPRFLSYSLSHIIAEISYVFYRSAVVNVKGNLSRAFPGDSEKELSIIAKKLFRNYSKYLVDYGRFTRLNKAEVLNKIIRFDGEENLHAALKMNKGVILLTAHLGNWELGGIFFASYGIKMNVVTLMDVNSEIDEMRSSYREKHNVNTITLGSPFSSIEMLKALNNKETVAMLIDRYHGGLDNITTDFFSRPTQFPRGPFILARLSEAPVIVAFVIREGDVYKGIIEKPMLIANEKEENEALKKTVKILEKYIIMYPDQWYNFRPI
jgi:KDO2-lipid IV(A) lauroyltransferase